jgi:hypothetical protein
MKEGCRGIVPIKFGINERGVTYTPVKIIAKVI